jgi:hypothetical protein
MQARAEASCPGSPAGGTPRRGPTSSSRGPTSSSSSRHAPLGTTPSTPPPPPPPLLPQPPLSAYAVGAKVSFLGDAG